MMTKLSLLALLFAGLAGVLKLNPEVVLKVPKFGVVLWAMIGGSIPPMIDNLTFSSCIKKGDCPWLKSGDVVVTTCGKCGTHWIMTMVHELRTWNLTDLKDFEDVLDVMPWAEMKHYPGETISERVDYWGHKWNNTRFPFKVFKAHFDATAVPVIERPDIKFIAGTRNAEDVIISAQTFFTKHSKEFTDLWGNFPPRDATFDETIDIFMNKHLSSYYYFKSWYSMRNEPNVLLLHYSDVFKNPRKYIEIVAKFLGLNEITKEALDIVEKRISIEFMKKKGDKYRYIVGKNRDIVIFPDGDGIVNKGGIGEKTGRSVLSKEQKQRLMDLREECFGENNLLARIADSGFESVQKLE